MRFPSRFVRFSKGTWWRFQFHQPVHGTSWSTQWFSQKMQHLFSSSSTLNGPWKRPFFWTSKNWTEHKRNHQNVGSKESKTLTHRCRTSASGYVQRPSNVPRTYPTRVFWATCDEQKWMVNLPEIWSGIWHIAESPPDLRSYNKRQTLYAVEDVASNTTRNFELTESYRNRSAKCSWLHI